MEVNLNLFIKIKKAKEKRLSERTKLFQNKIYINNIIIVLSNNNTIIFQINILISNIKNIKISNF